MKTLTIDHCVSFIKWRFPSQRSSYCRKSKVIPIIKKTNKQTKKTNHWKTQESENTTLAFIEFKAETAFEGDHFTFFSGAGYVDV